MPHFVVWQHAQSWRHRPPCLVALGRLVRPCCAFLAPGEPGLYPGVGLAFLSVLDGKALSGPRLLSVLQTESDSAVWPCLAPKSGSSVEAHVLLGRMEPLAISRDQKTIISLDDRAGKADCTVSQVVVEPIYSYLAVMPPGPACRLLFS